MDELQELGVFKKEDRQKIYDYIGNNYDEIGLDYKEAAKRVLGMRFPEDEVNNENIGRKLAEKLNGNPNDYDDKGQRTRAVVPGIVLSEGPDPRAGERPAPTRPYWKDQEPLPHEKAKTDLNTKFTQMIEEMNKEAERRENAE